MWYQFKPYVSVAKRRANAAREVSNLKKKGQKIEPVVIEGRKIATTFWGQSWCESLEAYSDFSNRLPRGRTYVCNGSVVDLQIEPGKITALVSGSSLYRVAIEIDKLPDKSWQAIRAACAGQIGSIVELLQGQLSKHVMEIVTRPADGLFPKPKEIRMGCSCPDWAGLCKHLAAVLYGVGARLDHRPELLFQLRQVDHLELVEKAVEADSGRAAAKAGKKTIAAGDLADVFGIEIDSQAATVEPTSAPARKRRGSARSAKSPRAGEAVAEVPAEPAARQRKPRSSRKVAPAAGVGDVPGAPVEQPATARGKRVSRGRATVAKAAGRPAGRGAKKRAVPAAAAAISKGKKRASRPAALSTAKASRNSPRPK